MRLDLFYKQIRLTSTISDRNGGDFETKNVSVTQLCGNQILLLLFVSEILFSTSKLDWILNSSFLQYLATTLQTNISKCYPTLGNTEN